MLISFKKRFIFVANTKSASTTIEHLLEKHCQIAIREQRFGKHLPYAKIEEIFEPLFEFSGDRMEEYLRFGVIRDPVSWIVSWYNYRQREALPRSNPKSSHDVTFPEFVEEVVSTGKRKPFAQLGAQKNKLLDGSGKIGVDYLIPLNRLQGDLSKICSALGLATPAAVGKVFKNRSPVHFNQDNVSDEHRAALEKYYQEDLELYQMAVDGKFGTIDEVLLAKQGKPGTIA